MNKNWKKQFFTIYLGQAFSLFGSSAVQFAVIWWLTVQTESAITLTVAAIAAFLPSLLIGPFAGIWIDRMNRRTVMIAADGLVALSSVALGLMFLLIDAPPVGFIYLILFVRGLGNTFHGPAIQAAIPLLVPQEMLTKAGGWGNLVNSGTAMLGPVLGAALMEIMHMSGIMLVDIFGAVFAIVCLLFVKIPDIPQSGERTQALSDMKDGLRAIRANKPLLAVAAPLALVNILYNPLVSLFPLLVRTHYMGGMWRTSIAELIFACGLLASSIVIGVWGGMKRRFLMSSLAIGILGAGALLSGILPSGRFMIFVVCCFFSGAGGAFINVPMMAYTQESIAPEMLGKVISMLMAAMSLAMPIGLLVAGPVSEAVGVERWFFWSGVAILITAILCRVLTKPYDTETTKTDKLTTQSGDGE